MSCHDTLSWCKLSRLSLWLRGVSQRCVYELFDSFASLLAQATKNYSVTSPLVSNNNLLFIRELQHLSERAVASLVGMRHEHPEPV